MKLGYSPEEVAQIVDYIDANAKIEGAPFLKEEHLAVFDCSFTPIGGGRSISWKGHLRMMAAAQPFLSGAISKTINMPEESTIEDIMQAYIESWKLGLKSVAIYRDNSKGSQPMSAATKKDDGKAAATAVAAAVPAEAVASTPLPLQPLSSTSCSPAALLAASCSQRTQLHHPQILHRRPRRLPHRRQIRGWHPRRNLHQDGQGRVHVVGHHGRFRFVRFDLSAIRRSAPRAGRQIRQFAVSSLPATPAIPKIRYAKSVVDYLGRWLGAKFISPDYLDTDASEAEARSPAWRSTPHGVARGSVGVAAAAKPATAVKMAETETSTRHRATVDDAPSCSECGMLMTPNGSCYKCSNCGGTSGCS